MYRGAFIVDLAVYAAGCVLSFWGDFFGIDPGALIMTVGSLSKDCPLLAENL